MTFEQKGIWMLLFITIATYITYVVIILTRAVNTPLMEVAYQSTLLWAIGISIAVSILGMIGIAISKPSEADKKDARDKEINRFGEYVGGIVLGTAMIVPFILALAQFDHFWIANAMYSAFVLSGIVSAIVKLVIYHRGL